MTDIEATQARAKRQLRSLLLAVVVSFVIVAAAPILFHSVFGFPLFSLRSWLTAGAVTFVFAVPGFWVAFSHRADVTARTGVIALSIIVIVSVFIAWRFH
jgi:hypothetical protein